MRLVLLKLQQGEDGDTLFSKEGVYMEHARALSTEETFGGEDRGRDFTGYVIGEEYNCGEKYTQWFYDSSIVFLKRKRLAS